MDINPVTQAFYWAIKSSARCVVSGCGKKKRLEYHHVYKESKITTIYNVGNYGTAEDLVIELKKCIPVCRSCHRAIHRGRLKGYFVGLLDNGKEASDASRASKHMVKDGLFMDKIGIDIKV